MNVAVIIPAYNEEKHVGKVIEKTIAQGYTPIVVDDGSKDATSKVAQEAGATVLTHIVNLGKGAAAKTGCEWAVKQKAEVIVLMDADGQHKPEDIKRFLKALDKKDIVFGYRRLDTKMPIVMRFGNWAINTTSGIVNKLWLKDTQSGYRAMSAEAYKKIRWQSADYGMESEMIAKAAKRHLRYAQIPIATIYHDNFKGTTIMDGLRIVGRLLKWRIIN